MRRMLLPLVLLAAPILAACSEETAASLPAPRELTREATGHYCGMIVADHPGPKAQLFLRSRAEPVWFSSVRDAFAFKMLPDEPKDIAAIFVNDMGGATDWQSPKPGTWIDARKAHFVIGSARRGGMGQQEAVPFSSAEAAKAFAAAHGGRVVAFDAVPRSYVLSEDTAGAGAHRGSHDGQTGDRKP